MSSLESSFICRAWILVSAFTPILDILYATKEMELDANQK